MPLTPKNRKEEWLQGLVDHETTLTPKNRPESWMKEIIDASGGGGGGGGGGGVLMVGTSGSPLTMDKTYSEIKSAYESGIVCSIIDEGDGASLFICALADENEGMFGVIMYGLLGQTTIIFTTNAQSGYPSYNG